MRKLSSIISRGGTGVTSRLTAQDLPNTGLNEGELSYVESTKSLYMWNGTTWNRVATGPQIGPMYTTLPPERHALKIDGTTSSFTVSAVDESGFPISYDWDALSGNTVYNNDNLPPMLTAVSESNGTFTFTPSTSPANADQIIFRTKASDGVLYTPATTTLVLAFGLGNVTGFQVEQTATGWSHTVWNVMLLGASGDLFQDAALRSSAVVGPITPAWGHGITAVNHPGAAGDAEMLSHATNNGFTVQNPFYVASVSESTTHTTLNYQWTSGGITVQRFLITGSMSNGYTYFNGGRVRFYIGGVLEPEWRTLTKVGNMFFANLMPT